MAIVSLIDSGYARKILNVLVLSCGMSIFSGLVLLKVDAWARKQEEAVRTFADQLEVGTQHYQKAMVEVEESKTR